LLEVTKVEPLNMHGHANTFEEELVEVCREREELREKLAAAERSAREMHIAADKFLREIRRLGAAIETAAAMVRHADPDLADAFLRTLDSHKDDG
jgi:predicted  nucleic acid-binding Zn-ribbon protein